VRAERRRRILERRLLELIRDRILRYVWQRELRNGKLETAIQRLVNRETDPYTLAEEIVRRVIG
jgi:LAO/AO transport system kinase